MTETMIVGQYKIIEKIGEGGMGIVYKAMHTTLEQIVALKSVPVSLNYNQDIRNRFIKEAKIQAKLSHPNIVNLHNFFEHKDILYLVMEYVEGETLASLIKKNGAIPIEKCVEIFKQTLRGVGYAHSKGIIHRDIKPSNIMLNSEGAVKITDFGVAKIVDDLNKTQTIGNFGTISYMSPEQITGQPAGIASDIYALGITLFEMVTGKSPFSGTSGYQIMKSIVENMPRSPREINKDIPAFFEDTILRAIEKNPEDRFKETKEFLKSLENEGSYHYKKSSKPSRRIIENVMSNFIRYKRLMIAAGAILAFVSVLLIYSSTLTVKNQKNDVINSNFEKGMVEPIRIKETKSQPAVESANTREETTGERVDTAKKRGNRQINSGKLNRRGVKSMDRSRSNVETAELKENSKNIPEAIDLDTTIGKREAKERNIQTEKTINAGSWGAKGIKE